LMNCAKHWKKAVKIMKPKLMVAMGVHATAAITGNIPLEARAGAFKRMRGAWHEYRGIALRVMDAPSRLLNYPQTRVQAWEDIQAVMQRLRLLEHGEDHGS